MKIPILGYAESRFTKSEDELSTEEMVYYTVHEALQNANLELKDIETILHSADDILEGIAINHTVAVEPSGAFLKEESKVEEDGCFGLFYAVQKVLTEFDTAMIVAYSKSSNSSLKNDPNRESFMNDSDEEVSGSWYYQTQLEPFYLRPLGIDFITYHALQCQSFLADSKLSEDDLAKILIKNKKHGLSNPNAIYSGEYSLDDVLRSDYIATPIKKIELPLQTDGCSVLIIGKEGLNHKTSQTGSFITGLGLNSDTYYPGHRNLSCSVTAHLATQGALKMASKKTEDIHMAELYDLFPYQEALLYRDILGWQPPDISKKLEEGYTSENGKLPINLSGGISCAHPIMAAGLSRVISLCKNLKEEDMHCGLAHSQSGMGMQSNIVYIIENE